MPPPPAPSITDWMQGLGTVAGALIAVFAVIAAVLAYRAQNEQLRHQQKQIADQQELNLQQSEVLKLQADELRESIADRRRVAQEQRRAQAAQVFLELAHFVPHDSGHTWTAGVINSSGQPIHNVRMYWHLGLEVWDPGVEPGREGNPRARLAPQQRWEWVGKRPRTASLDPKMVGVVVEFRDANEVWWRITPDGRITETPAPNGV